ncbi:MAG: amino acid ABC transporter substrate-binding protein [Thermogutta sp.]|nr:amino acid ABC transporter substrate-binding protein [Thermogutta sp.]
MRFIMITVWVLVVSAGLIAHEKQVRGDEPAQSPQSGPSDFGVPVEPSMKPVLDAVLSIRDPYHVPQLPLRVDQNYGHTPRDLEPFGYVAPFKRHFMVQMEYTGPGRAIPEPEHVDTVKIGFLGPIESTVSVATGGKSHEENIGKMMLKGAQLAVEKANEQGGYHRRKVPFELIVRNDNGLWGASGNEIIHLAYKEQVWAIVGTIDGANSHIAIRVALKAEVPMVNTGDTDPTFIETNIPWVFRVISDDRRQCYLLVDYIFRKVGIQKLGIIRASNRYGRFGVRELRDGSRRLGKPVPLEMAYFVGQSDFSLELQRLKDAGVEAVAHWGDAEDGARILNQMREMGMKQPFFACDRCLGPEFAEIAGNNAEGVVCASPWNPDRDDPRLKEFRERFTKRFGVEPDTYAAHAFDGTEMLIWAIQVAGLNRAKIRDVLAYRNEPWQGVVGKTQFTAALDGREEVFLAIREGQQWRYYSREELNIPSGEIEKYTDHLHTVPSELTQVQQP